MDENVVQPNVIDVSATALTVGQMTTDVAAAFDAGMGGVVDFDNGAFAGPRTIDILYAGGTKVLRMTNGARDWSIGVLGTNPASGAISGGNAIFLGGANVFNEFDFGDVTDAVTGALLPERVASFGFTIVDSFFNGIPNDVILDVTYSNDTVQRVTHQIPLAGNTADTFFGFTAPPGLFIKELRLQQSNNVAGEDFTFITTVVPEPAAGGLAVIAACGIAALRRRSR